VVPRNHLFDTMLDLLGGMLVVRLPRLTAANNCRLRRLYRTPAGYFILQSHKVTSV